MAKAHRKKTHRLEIRLTDAQAAALKRWAEAEQKSVAEYIRSRIERRLGREIVGDDGQPRDRVNKAFSQAWPRGKGMNRDNA